VRSDAKEASVTPKHALFVKGIHRSQNAPATVISALTNGGLRFTDVKEFDTVPVYLAEGESEVCYIYDSDSNGGAMYKRPVWIGREWRVEAFSIGEHNKELRLDYMGTQGGVDKYFFSEPTDAEKDDILQKSADINNQDGRMHWVLPIKMVGEINGIGQRLNPKRPEIPQNAMVMWNVKQEKKLGYDVSWMAVALQTIQSKVTLMAQRLMKYRPIPMFVGIGTLSHDKSLGMMRKQKSPTSRINFASSTYQALVSPGVIKTPPAQEKMHAAMLHLLSMQVSRVCPIEGFTVGDYVAMTTELLREYVGTTQSVPLDKFFEVSSVYEQILKFFGANIQTANFLLPLKDETWEEYVYLWVLLGLMIARGHAAILGDVQLIRVKTTDVKGQIEHFKRHMRPGMVTSDDNWKVGGLTTAASPFFVERVNKYGSGVYPWPMLVLDEGEPCEWFRLNAKGGVSYKRVDVKYETAVGNFPKPTGDEYLAFTLQNDVETEKIEDQLGRQLRVLTIPLWKNETDETVPEALRQFLFFDFLFSAGTVNGERTTRLDSTGPITGIDPVGITFTEFYNFALVAEGIPADRVLTEGAALTSKVTNVSVPQGQSTIPTQDATTGKQEKAVDSQAQMPQPKDVEQQGKSAPPKEEGQENGSNSEPTK
jgi:hypothetical protein